MRGLRGLDEKIFHYNAYGATEGALNLLEALKNNVETARDWRELLRLLVSQSENALEKRPTSALLSNTLRDLLLGVKEIYERNESFDNAIRHIVGIIDKLEKETVESIEKLGLIGSRRLPENSVILVHSYSTSVIKILENAFRQGKVREVFVTESRPGGEGLVTAKLLAERGMKVNLIVDSAVNFFMNDIDIVLLGAEAITANGALVNKIGSSLIALSAYYKRTRVLVASGTYKFSFETILGERIRIPTASAQVIEPPEELLLNTNVRFNLPLMDVTPPNYIDAIITEEGVTSPEAVPIVLWEKHGGLPIGQPDIYNILKELRKIGENI